MLGQLGHTTGEAGLIVQELWAVRSAAKRAAARQRIHVRAVHPIDVPRLVRDPLVRRRTPLASTFAAARLVAVAAGAHLLGLTLLVAVGRVLPDRPRFAPPEPIKVHVLESPPRPSPSELPVAPEPGVAEPALVEPPKPEVAKAPAAKVKAEPPKRPVSKVDAPAPSPEGSPPKEVSEVKAVPLIGLSLESTVSGNGPSFATGTSRMGASPAGVRAALPHGSEVAPSAPGAGDAVVPGGQRAATAIPTRDEQLVKPRRLAAHEPGYPAVLRAQGIEGDVLVTVSIDASGAVLEAAVLRGSGHAEFDAAALSAARAERFAPASRDGVPVAYTLSYSYHFRIED